MAEVSGYTKWSQENLITRVLQLEAELKAKNQSALLSPTKKSWKKPRIERVFDPSKYSTRLVALKLAYLGKRYNGFEHHSGQITARSTIEEELWKALNKARLIFPTATDSKIPGEINWEGTEYSKCGRTDKGVSAFGQVIGIRVRSNRPLPKRTKMDGEALDVEYISGDDIQRSSNHDLHETHQNRNGFEENFNTNSSHSGIEVVAPPLALPRGEPANMPLSMGGIRDADLQESLNFDPITDELDYPSILNHLLPPDIRILAWCPAPPLNFSARFSCRERRYRYFFTQPAFLPTPHSCSTNASAQYHAENRDGWLDIDAMREAAHKFQGVHDFRNFCKVDAGKQISNFERRIYYSDIEEVADTTQSLAFLTGPAFLLPQTSLQPAPKIYTFTLHGSAFLWHQVRCMVAILFLVGQGLEKPSIVSELLNVSQNQQRPTYEMAMDTPLVLWDCIFPREDDPGRKDALQWVYVGDGKGQGDAKYGNGALTDALWKVWRERKVDEMLAGSLLGLVSGQGVRPEDLSPPEGSGAGRRGVRSQRVFDGGDGPRLQGSYIPVMKKPKMRSVDVINDTYAMRKGFESSEEMKEVGFRRLRMSEKREKRDEADDVLVHR